MLIRPLRAVDEDELRRTHRHARGGALVGLIAGEELLGEVAGITEPLAGA
jgi:hypothetical protein